MPVCVGIDVNRKRSRVTVIDAKGEVLAGRNTPDGVEPIPKVIGGLPPGTHSARAGWRAHQPHCAVLAYMLTLA